MKHHIGPALILFLIFAYSGCLVIENTFTGIAPGPWRGVLKLKPQAILTNPRGEPLPEAEKIAFEEVTEGELPFNFEVFYENDTSFYFVIQNGAEKIRLDEVQFGRRPGTMQDTLLVRFPEFGTYLQALHEDGVIEGKFYDPSRSETYAIPFVAKQGKDYRFTNLRKTPVMDVSGRWEVRFGIETDSPYPAIGIFEQDGNHLSGTFLTETGDYRFLEGTVQDDKLYLSAFDGSHAFLFEARIRPDSTMIGSFRSGTHYLTTWEARLNPEAALSDPTGLTKLKPEVETFVCSFPNPEEEMISTEDEKYQGKVRIIQLFGTWCPNSRDATIFLRDYLAENKHPDLAVIGLAFERSPRREAALEAIRNYRKSLNLDYEILLAGEADKEKASQALPMLNEVVAYPTLIFLDRNGAVRKIHTGFTGPATPDYEKFTVDFNVLVKDLINEQEILTTSK